jgi:hypothetical protein
LAQVQPAVGTGSAVSTAYSSAVGTGSAISTGNFSFFLKKMNFEEIKKNVFLFSLIFLKSL